MTQAGQRVEMAKTYQKQLQSASIRYSFFDSFMIIYPVYPVMFQDAGVSQLEISYLLSIWCAGIFFLQPIAGLLIDKFPRRRILALGNCARALCLFIWIVFPNFWGFAIGLLFWSLRSVFSGNPFDALVFDSLKHRGIEGDYLMTTSRVAAASRLALITASLLASYAVPFGYNFICLICIAISLTSALLALQIPEIHHTESQATNFSKHLGDALLFILSTRSVIALFVVSILLYGVSETLDEFYSIVARGQGLSVESIGIFFALLHTLDAAAYYAMSYFKRADFRAIGFFSFLGGVSLWTGSFFTGLAGYGSLPIYLTLCRCSALVLLVQMQEQIPGRVRGMVLSVNCSAIMVSSITFTLLFGYVVENYSIEAGLRLFATVSLIISSLAFTRVFFERYRLRNTN